MNDLSAEDQAAAVVVANLAGKRGKEDSPDAAGGVLKRARHEEDLLAGLDLEPIPVLPIIHAPELPVESEHHGEELKPYPFYYYKDFSTEEDDDPFTPLTAPGRVPNFPAKMHAILSRPDLADIVTWLPHGRSWKVLKPREFEIRVIPTYFEHAKFSSFIRQANGWGFRRITTGKDRNSYYHPRFLRALPHLCKEMKRPGVAKKLAADPEHEPDFYAISEAHPVPTKCSDDSILLHCTLQGGPKARMPIYSGSLVSSSTIGSSYTDNVKLAPAESKKAAAMSITAPAAQNLTPRDQETLSAFQDALGASEVSKPPVVNTAPQQAVPIVPMLPQAFAQVTGPMNAALIPSGAIGGNKVSTLAAANQLALHPTMAAFQASSQFAAGFSAALQLQNMMGAAFQQHMAAGFAAIPTALSAAASSQVVELKKD